MSETSEDTPNLDSAGEIVQSEKQSRWSFLKKPLNKVSGWVAMGKWAANEVRTGGYRGVKPGETAAKLKELRAKLDSTEPVTVDNTGNVIPQQPNSTLK